MSDLQTLIDMGFPSEKAQRALEVTGNKGVEPAMEWLLAHGDEEIPTTSVEPESNKSDEKSEEQPATTEETPATEQTAKSLKCDECNKLFKNQTEVEYHAAKTNHSSFSESTEEKKPLTEEEKKAQLALLEQKIREKRQLREETERKDALERERLRIKSGKDMLEAKKKMEELEMQKIMEQRKREKQEEKMARERVRAQIEADKAARRAKAGIQTETQAQVTSPSVTSSSSSNSSPATPKTYTTTKIQIRFFDGSTLTETFDVKEQLAAVRLFIQLKLGAHVPVFGLMTNFPKKVFKDDDFDTPLEKLGLVPSAVLIVTKQ
uniref:Putative ubiquitin regulatory protein n=1 Tax=Corethrella appendiculata TaxID=1370023 RepID=U5EYS9_9DIPT